MQKQLVTIDNLDDFICKAGNTLYMDGTKILTPGAKDELSRRGIAIEYGCNRAPQGTSCAASNAPQEQHVEDMLIAVAATLQKEYGINDPVQLKTMSQEIVKTLSENLSIF